MGKRWKENLGSGVLFVAILLLLSMPAEASTGVATNPGPVPALKGGPSLVQGGSSRSIRSGLCGNTGAPACWADGLFAQITPPDCFDGTDLNGLASAYTGYWIADDGGYPATGDRYWGHVVASYGILACLAATSIEAILPPNTEFALDPSLPENAGRIRCFFSYLGGPSPRTYEFTGESGQNDSCFNRPGVGFFGNSLGFATMTTTLDEYTMFEIVFPIRSQSPLRGIASSNHKLRSRVGFNFDPVLPEAWVSVGKSAIGLNVRRAGSKVLARGTLSPASAVRTINARAGSGPRVTVFFSGRKRGRTVNLGTKSLSPSFAGAFSTTFPRRAGTSRCRVTATWAGVARVSRFVYC